MATMSVNMPDNLFEDLQGTDFEEIASEAIEACLPDAEKAVKDSIRSVLKDKGRTELIDSIRGTKAMKSRKTEGMVAFVRATGKPKSGGRRKRGDRARGSRAVSNNDIAFWLEYGNSHQGAKPYINKAISVIESEVFKKCQEVLDRKTGAK